MTAQATELRDRLQEALGADCRIEREVGGGGMSRVFAARDLKLNRHVVVKVLPPELSGEVNIERFKREIMFAASLQHPHIVPLHTAGDVDGLPYYEMPLVEGESLRARLLRVQRLPVADVLRILRDITRALAYAHRRGVVHRDIKPENVLIIDGVAQVTDFGIAKAIAESRDDANEPASIQTGQALTVTGSFLGTPLYMAPEQALASAGADHRVDLYALGVVAYELLTGAAPFQDRSDRERLAARLTESPRDVAALRLDVPPEVGQLVMRLLERDPDARPQTAEEVLRGIEAALVGPVLPVAHDEPAVIRRAYGIYAVAFLVAASLAWLAMNAIGLPDWVLPGTILIMTIGFFVVTFTAVGRYAAFKLLNAAGGGAPGPMLWQQTTGARSLWIAEHVSWKRVAAGGSMALGGFGMLVAGFMFSRNAGIGPFASLIGRGTLQAQERVLFTNLDVTGVDSSLASAISVAARTALQQSRAISVMTSEQVQQALTRMRKPGNERIDLALGRELATREGVRALIAGYVAPAGGQFAVSLRLVSADSGRELAEAHQSAASLEDIIPTIDAVSRDLRGKIGESLKGVRQSPSLPDVTTSSLQALRLYADHFNTNSHDQQLQLLRQAIAADSEFASAYRRLYILGSSRGERDSAIVKAVRLSARLPERERLQVEAYHYMLTSLFPEADRAKAIAILEQLAEMGDVTGMIDLPEFLFNRREYARAESLSRRNIERQPNVPNSHEALVHALVEQGKLDEAERAIEESLRKFPDIWGLQWWKVRMPFLRGRYDEFERLVDSLRLLPDQQRRTAGVNAKVALAGMRGRLRERDRLRPSNPNARRDSITVALSGFYDAFDYGRDTAAAVQRLEAAFPQDRNPAGTRAWGLAVAFNYAKRPDLVRAVLDRFQSSGGVSEGRIGKQMFTHKIRAELAMAEGRWRDAVDEVRLGDMLPDGPYGPCHLCLYRDLSRAFDVAGETDSTIFWAEKFVNSPSTWSFETLPGYLPRVLRRLGELHEKKGQRAKAAEYYGRFVELWKNADPELQPLVAEFRARQARLRG